MVGVSIAEWDLDMSMSSDTDNGEYLTTGSDVTRDRCLTRRS